MHDLISAYLITVTAAKPSKNSVPTAFVNASKLIGYEYKRKPAVMDRLTIYGCKFYCPSPDFIILLTSDTFNVRPISCISLTLHHQPLDSLKNNPYEYVLWGMKVPLFLSIPLSDVRLLNALHI